LHLVSEVFAASCRLRLSLVPHY